MEKLTSGLPFENIRVKYSIPKELWEEIIATFHNLIEDLDLENSEKENLLRKFALFIRAGSKYDLEDLTAAVKKFPEV